MAREPAVMPTKQYRPHGLGAVVATRDRRGYSTVRGRLRLRGVTYWTRGVGVGRGPSADACAEARTIVEGRLGDLRRALGVDAITRDRLASVAGGIEGRRPGIAPGMRFAVLARCGFRCAYCGRRAPDVELHVDHVVPLARGGPDDATNLVAACAECNLGKADRLVGEEDRDR